MLKSIFLWVIIVFASVASPFCLASDLVEIYPVTNKILMLHFKDGTVQYHGYHQKDQDDSVIQNKLDLTEAAKPGTYQIQSGDDSHYSSGINPSSVGRKSKGMGFSRNCKWDGQRCNNDYVLEHWIYLQLPQALQRGKTYKVKTGRLAANLQESTLLYDEKTARSVAIHINQIGYLPDARQKFGYISHWMGDLGPLSLEEYANSQFQLVRSDTGETFYSGPISKQKDLKTGGPDTGQMAETPTGILWERMSGNVIFPSSRRQVSIGWQWTGSAVPTPSRSGMICIDKPFTPPREASITSAAASTWWSLTPIGPERRTIVLAWCPATS